MSTSTMRTEGWSEGDAVAFLEGARVPLRLAFAGADGAPRLVSLWYAWREGAFWSATPATAFAARQIAANGTCAFEASTNHPPYRGVRGTGTAVLVPDRGQEWLSVLVDRYLTQRNAALRASRGDWLQFFDADDLLSPDTLMDTPLPAPSDSCCCITRLTTSASTHVPMAK